MYGIHGDDGVVMNLKGRAKFRNAIRIIIPVDDYERLTIDNRPTILPDDF